MIKGVATWVTGGLPLLSPLSSLVGVVSATSSSHIPPFCPLSIIREWRAAKMATAVSAHFKLQKCSSETYGWRHGHVFYSLWLQHIFKTLCQAKKQELLLIFFIKQT